MGAETSPCIGTFAGGRSSRSLCVKRVGAAPPHWACAGSCEAHLRVAPQSGGQIPPEQASQPAAAPRGGGQPAPTLCCCSRSHASSPTVSNPRSLRAPFSLAARPLACFLAVTQPCQPLRTAWSPPLIPSARGWRPLPACCSLEQVCSLPLGTSCLEERELYEVNNKETIIYTPGVKVNLQNSNNHKNSIHK